MFDEITQDNYVAARNALIPDAVRAANIETGHRIHPSGSAPDEAWSQAFLRNMDRLAHLHGVVK